MIQLQINPTNNWLKNNGYSREEEKKIYIEQLKDIYDNPRYYLDNLDYMIEYRLSGTNYRKK